MTTIYKTRGEVKAPLLSLPCSREDALSAIKRTAKKVNWSFTEAQSGIEVRFADGTIVIYSAEENSYLCTEDNRL